MKDNANPAEDTVDHTFFTWERVIGIAVLGQLLLIVIVAAYFAWLTNAQNHTLASQALASTASNRAIIQEIRDDLTVHARASTDRNCAIADELRYLVHQSPDVKARVLRKVNGFTQASCLFIPPHITATG